MVKKIGLAIMILLPVTLLAQSPQSAVGGGSSVWAGAEFSTFNPDYGCHSTSPFTCADQLLGPGVFFDVNNLWRKLGVEGEARWLRFNGTGDMHESNYLAGLRYRAIRYHRLDGYVKALAGGGWITTPHYPQAGSLQGSYFDIAAGGTVEYSFTRRLALRGDYEFQFWPSFSGPATYTGQGMLQAHNNGVTPNGFSIGVTYRIFGGR